MQDSEFIHVIIKVSMLKFLSQLNWNNNQSFFSVHLYFVFCPLTIYM